MPLFSGTPATKRQSLSVIVTKPNGQATEGRKLSWPNEDDSDEDLLDRQYRYNAMSLQAFRRPSSMSPAGVRRHPCNSTVAALANQGIFMASFPRYASQLPDETEYIEISPPPAPRGWHTNLPPPPASFKQIFRDFCSRTSSHGIPHIGESVTLFGKLFWVVIFTVCFTAFIYQTSWTFQRYLRFDKIIEMELKFEAAPFPAVTVCNLNPYRYSELVKIPSLKQNMDVYEHIVNSRQQNKGTFAVHGHNADNLGTGYDPDVPTPTTSRARRSAQLIPTNVNCKCERNIHMECVPARDLTAPAIDRCICYLDESTGSIWPCYHYTAWHLRNCTQCTFARTCSYPFDDAPRDPYGELPRNIPCLCQNISYSCLIKNESLGWYDPYAYNTMSFETALPTTTVDPSFIAQMGVEGYKDSVAITAKANENLAFAAAQLPREVRLNISYDTYKLLLRCSFNGQPCDTETDFVNYLDPIYGNCFIFNYNKTVKKLNSRAGPMYGLRLLLNVNQTDYLPTTEMAGVRITVHDRKQQPFPDIFGYSAPTGLVSSFGLRSVELERLSEPYGKCIGEGNPAEYVRLRGEKYSVEHCYRTCFQELIMTECNCGDPRLPIDRENRDRLCKVENLIARACIQNITESMGQVYSLQKACGCIQPCSESTYSVTYSAALWPAQQYSLGNCDFIGEGQNRTSCIQYYKDHTAFIEIYYEQLNFETRREKEAYGIESLLSDFGGNIGLWIGFSMITAIEIILLFIELLLYCCRDDPLLRQKLQRRRQGKHKARHSADTEVLGNTLNTHDNYITANPPTPVRKGVKEGWSKEKEALGAKRSWVYSGVSPIEPSTSGGEVATTAM